MDVESRSHRQIDRRRFLKLLSVGLTGVASASLLAACQSAPAPAATSKPAETPKPAAPAASPAAAAPVAAPASPAASPAAGASPAASPAAGASPAASPAAAAKPTGESEASLIEGARKEGTLSILHGMPQVTLEALAGEFKKKYPFATVEIERQQGLAAYEKYASEFRSGTNIRDVVHVADIAGYQRLITDNMIMQYKVPTDSRYPAAFKLGDGHAYITYKTEIVIAVNDQLVSKDEGKVLENWEGILDPKWKGRIGTLEPAGGTTYAIVMMLLHPPTPGRFGEDFLKKFAAQEPTIFNNTAVAMERLLAGQVHVLFTHWEADALNRLQTGAPVRWYAPKPVPSFGNSPYGIAAKAPHPNMAKLWQNWFCGEEGATQLNKLYNSKSTMEGFNNVVDLPKADWYMPITDSWVPNPDDWAKYQAGDQQVWSRTLNWKIGG